MRAKVTKIYKEGKRKEGEIKEKSSWKWEELCLLFLLQTYNAFDIGFAQSGFQSGL
jgi:hypothetical protein